MNRYSLILPMFVAAFVVCESAQAQFGVPVWTQPAPVVWAQPAPVVVQRPVVVQSAPVFVQPAPVVTTMPTRVYRAPMIGYTRTPQVITRRRPILGGTSTRVIYNYQRVLF